MRLTREQKKRIRELYEQDKTYREIAEIIGCSICAAWYHSQTPENMERNRKSKREWYHTHKEKA